MDILLRKALRAARDHAGGPGQGMYLAKLGNLLKQEGAWWDGKLTDLLRDQREFCTLEGDRVLFREGELVDVSGTDERHQLWLKESLYAAMLFSSEVRAQVLDMETWQVVAVARDDGGALGSPYAEEPWRYLEIPPWPTDEQISFAVDELELGPRDAAALKEAGHRWAAVSEAMVEPSRWAAFLKSRREAVLERAIDFLDAHHVPKGRFIYRRDHLVPTRGGRDMTSLRRALHRAIDRMTEDELQRLQIPARLLVERS